MPAPRLTARVKNAKMRCYFVVDRREKGGWSVAGERDAIGNTGLAERLEQHSRKNGVALGVAMGVCILIAIAGFIYLYTRITILPDFATRLETTSVAAARAPAGGTTIAGAQGITPPATVPRGTPNQNATAQASVPTSTPGSNAATPAPTDTATGTGTRPAATPTATFRPNFRIAGGFTINFRSEPGKSSAIVKTLPPGTELQFLNQTQELDGEVWRRLRDTSGAEGWVRDIDLEKIPG